MPANRIQLRVLALSVFALLIAGLAFLNVRGERSFAAPSDGALWVEAGRELRAQAIKPGSPAALAAIQLGDALVRINGQPVYSASDVARHLYIAGIGAQAQYEILRRGSLMALDLRVGRETRPGTVRAFVRLAAVFYLLIGLFILWRRSRARRSTLFYLYCLASFVLLFFSYTGQFDSIDWTVYWMSVAAILLQPALFAHFCLSYRDAGYDGLAPWTWLLPIYGAAGLIGMLHLGVAFGYLRFAAPLGELRWLLDRLELGYVAAMYAAGLGLLTASYRQARTRLAAKQAGWVLGSAAAGLGPFTACYAIPYFLGRVPGAWMNLSGLSLVLLPLGMAYAIARYRLLEVEAVLRRGMAYTAATAALVGLYLGLAALAGGFVRQNFPSAGTAGLVLAVVVSGFLFQPLERWVQTQVDRYFLPKSYDYRAALLRIGRELSTETNLDRMISSLLEQLSETLQVQRAALFLRGDEETFVLRGALGFDPPQCAGRLDLGFLRLLEPDESAPQRGRLFFAGWQREVAEELGDTAAADPGWPLWAETIRSLELCYYFPCRTPQSMTAVLAVGRTVGGELLSDGDAALLEILAGYVAAAVQNVSLFESLTAKARQYEDLQQYSENILESINVGLMAVGLDGRVQSVNTPLELMYPLPFRHCRGRLLEELFPPELMAEIDRSRHDAGIHTIYRRRVRTEAGGEKVLNITIAPLLSKNCEWIGRLIIFDDVTDRVALEAQLTQAEKLSSIGLLAAGVAHEVNTPLTVISTQAQMLAKQLSPNDKNFSTVEKIIRQTFRASEIVNSLLNFSRTKGAAFAAVDLNKIVSETLLLLDHPLKTAGVNVETHLEPGLPLIHGGSDKLQQVLLNLFLNAKDAMQQGGQLRITTWTEDSRVRMEIRDTGSGIAPEHLPRIYDPFFTTKGPGRGTGLGLAVSYGIIREHAGRIHAESRPGMGTRFELEFPALRKPVHA